ncbi:hypothetical protein WOLCODRAFT_58272, partial [Wolfiporia cocos MD-104 SS10]
HDKVDITWLVRKLEKTVADEDWNASGILPPNAWIKTWTTLQVSYLASLLPLYFSLADTNMTSMSQKLKYARKLLNNRVKPASKGSSPLLYMLPLHVSSSPKPIVTISESPIPAQPRRPAEDPIFSDAITSAATQDLLLAIPLPPNIPTSPAVSPDISSSMPAFKQNSAAIQEERLSAQLAEMASQLRCNVAHFAGTLEKDKMVVLEVQEKLEHNYDAMSRERICVCDHHSKSWGTAIIVLL